MDDKNKNNEVNENNGYAPTPRINNEKTSDEKTSEVSTPTNSGSRYNDRTSSESSNVNARTSSDSVNAIKDNKGNYNRTNSNSSSNSSSNLNRSTNASNPTTSTSTPVYQPTSSEKMAGAEQARTDAQNRYNEEERLRRQREASEKSKLDIWKSKNKKETVSLAAVVPPTARTIEPPKTRDNKVANREEINNIKNQVRVASSPKLTIKQALGRNISSTSKAIVSEGKDLVGAMGSEYAGAEYVKQKAKNTGVRVATAVGAGSVIKATNIAKEGANILTSENSAKTMADISTTIATKGAYKAMTIDKSIKERAENSVRKKAKKVEKLDKKYEKINKKELELREKSDKIYNKADKYKTKAGKYESKADKYSDNAVKSEKFKEKSEKLKAKSEKRSARGDKLNSKANRLRDKRARKNQKLGAKRSKATVRLNNVKAKARKKIERTKGFKKLLFKLVPAALVPICFIVIITSVVGGAAGAGGYMATKFVSGICDFLSLEWTATGKELARLENMNWAQYIADDTAVSLGDTFVDSAKKDAQMHYTDKKITLSEALGQLDNKSYPRYDWYCDLGEGNIGNVWMREQCDNITDKNGKMIYNSKGEKKGSSSASNLLYVSGGKIDTMSSSYGYDMQYSYESNENNRLTISPNANIIPILSLAHDRYTDEWTWENYEVVEAYVWYMYALSHNAAHYDAGPGYNKGDEGTYTYVTQQMCDKSMFSSNNYISKFGYDKEALSLSRPGTKEDNSDGVWKKVVKGTSCTNLYIHGYETSELFGEHSDVVNKAKDTAKKVAKKVLSWLDSIVETVTGDDSDLSETIMQDGTYVISYERDSATGLFKSGGKTWADNGKMTMESSYGYQSLNQILGGVKNGYGNTVYCDNIHYFKKNDTVTCGKDVHKHNTGNCKCPKEIHDHSSGCSYTKCGKVAHNHSSGCSYTKCGYTYEHTHNHTTGGDCHYTCGKTAHQHDASCPTKQVKICTKTQHTHIVGSFGCYVNGYYGATTCGIEPHICSVEQGCYKTEYDCSKEVHNHIDSCCSKSEHTHTPTNCCSIEVHNHIDSCCSKEKHPKHDSSCCTIKHTSHKGWVSASNPGCYDTFAYCAGHCGGHIKPSVNIAVTYTMEGLAYQDAVALQAGTKSGKDSSWTCSSDFRSLIEDLEDETTLKDWAKTTNKKCGKWFKAGPNGPISAICYIGDSMNKFKLKVFRGWRDFWKGLADKIFGGSDDEGPQYNDAPNDQEIKDLDEGEDDHNFEGWFTGSGSSLKFNPELFEELHDLYGDPATFYQDGVQTWKDFEVQFRVGFGEVLVDEYIDNIKSAVENKHYPTDADKQNTKNQNRMAIVETALESCGYFNYNKNAKYNNSDGMMGSINSLGFVSNVCKRALGDGCGFGTTGIDKNNFIIINHLSSLRPGDILQTTGDDEALVYIGNYKDPKTGQTGHYVVGISSTNKTSSYYKIKDNQLKQYYKCYRPNSIK